MISYTYEEKQTLGEALMQLFDIVTLLRSPEGCPWDREQTYKSVATNLVDETYEYLDSVISRDAAGMQEEIGDVFLNAMMLLEMHKEHGDVDIIEALNEVCAKLIRRHPHVFSDQVATNSSEVLDLWNTIKKDVEGKTSDGEDFFSRVPKSLPKLEEAWEIQKHMRKVGFDWPNIDGVIDKVDEERAELLDAITHRETDPSHVEEELGDLLFAVVNLARYLKINPSVALHRSNRKVRDRFNKLAKIGAQRDIPLSWEHVDKLNEIWEEIKLDEKSC
jgi:MazG family protein